MDMLCYIASDQLIKIRFENRTHRLPKMVTIIEVLVWESTLSETNQRNIVLDIPSGTNQSALPFDHHVWDISASSYTPQTMPVYCRVQSTLDYHFLILSLMRLYYSRDWVIIFNFCPEFIT